MVRIVFLLAIIGFISFYSIESLNAGWFCEHASSERNANIITTCGIAEANSEPDARRMALENAFNELDQLCSKSVDCKRKETLIEPQRSDCKKSAKGYKCVRAINAIITNTDRKVPYKSKDDFREQKQKLDVLVNIKVDPNELNKVAKSKTSCGVDTSNVSKSLIDLRTVESRNVFASHAVKVPVSNDCLIFHGRVMGLLKRYKIEVDKYSDHILNGLSKLADPEKDNFAYFTFRYFSSFHPLSDKEWSSLYQTMIRLKGHSLYRYIGYLYKTDVLHKTQVKRVNKFFEDVMAKKVGRPKALTIDEAMIQFLRSVDDRNKSHYPSLSIHALVKFGGKLKRAKPKRLHQVMVRLYGKVQGEAKEIVNRAIGLNISLSRPNYSFSKSVISYLRKFEDEIRKQDDEEPEGQKAIKFYNKLREDFLVKAHPGLGANLDLFKNEHDKKNRTILCIRYSIECKSLKLDDSKMSRHLMSKKPKKRLNALEIISSKPKLILKFEDNVVQGMLDAKKKRIKNSRRIITKSIDALSKINIKKKKTINALTHFCIEQSYNCKEITHKQGHLFVPAIMKEINRQGSTQLMRMFRLLGDMSSQAKSVVKQLESFSKNDKRHFVRSAAAKALVKIKGE